MLPQRSKHPRETVITPKASTSIFNPCPRVGSQGGVRGGTVSIYMYTYLSIYLSNYLSICLSIYIHIYIYIYIYICIYIYLSLSLYIYIYVCVCIYIFTLISWVLLGSRRSRVCGCTPHDSFGGGGCGRRRRCGGMH